MRKRLHPEALAACLREHLAADIRDALNSSSTFLDRYELSAPALLNAQAAQRCLKQALGYVNAAAVVTEHAVDN